MPLLHSNQLSPEGQQRVENAYKTVVEACAGESRPRSSVIFDYGVLFIREIVDEQPIHRFAEGTTQASQNTEAISVETRASPSARKAPDVTPETEAKVVEAFERLASKTAGELGELRQELTDTRNELAREKAQYNKAKDLAKDYKGKVDILQEKNKQMTAELNELARNTVPGQLDDNDIIEMADQLRSDIRNLTTQYFKENLELNSTPTFTKAKMDLQTSISISISLESVDRCVSNPQLRPVIIQDFIWSWLVSKVFWAYYWSPDNMSKAIIHLEELLYDHLKQGENTQGGDPKRKFHIWRVNTSNIVYEATAMRSNPDEDVNLQNTSSRLKDKLMDRIKTWVPTNNAPAIEQHMVDIIKKSIVLDMYFSKQIIRFQWKIFDDNNRYVKKFDGISMEPGPGQSQLKEGQSFDLVMAPGLVRYGRSWGSEYHVPQLLMKSQVAKLPI
ncbi:unnamed protein product [Clonostachys rosea]|uniref:Uncharacterized protein n=1 Tax=Bionectria ochroleuca TaxID=29856 RepID=A0ABY6UB15_BIOOC|nr:unnamed protein product [Clonostachys rosea]